MPCVLTVGCTTKGITVSVRAGRVGREGSSCVGVAERALSVASVGREVGRAAVVAAVRAVRSLRPTGRWAVTVAVGAAPLWAPSRSASTLSATVPKRTMGNIRRKRAEKVIGTVRLSFDFFQAAFDELLQLQARFCFE